MTFTKAASFPSLKAALIVNIAAEVLASRCARLDDSKADCGCSKELPDLAACFSLFKEKLIATEALSYEEARVFTEFMTR